MSSRCVVSGSGRRPGDTVGRADGSETGAAHSAQQAAAVHVSRQSGEGDLAAAGRPRGPDRALQDSSQQLGAETGSVAQVRNKLSYAFACFLADTF